ncbi:MAG TPA: hypothetical protein VGO25_04780 [Rhodanobacteraceae bacterium]|nr:hypothetical protein [Rhodanobacteraceae bacterium]
MNNAPRLLILGAGSMLALSATAANLIVNPDFDTSVDGWTTATAGNGTATLDPSTGSPTAPSIHLVANPANSDVTITSSCMPIDDSNNVDLYTNIKGNAGFAIATINTFSDAACVTGLTAMNSDSVPATGTWATYSMTDVALPDGTQSAQVLLTVTMGSSTSAGDANFDHVAFGPTGTVLSSVNVNQEGLSGTWYNPATSGQGMQFAISPDDSNPGEGSLFGAWYTYDVTSGGTDSQRWYSVQSSITGDEQSASVTIFQNTGGNFDAPPVTSAVAVGTGTLSFDSCVSGSFSYALDDGRSGTIPLQRLLPNVDCVDTGTPTNPASDFGLSGSWYEATTSGQGMLIEINPGDATAFIGWYTYAASGASNGAAGQRWFSAQSDYAAGSNTASLIVYASTGGIFNSSAGVVSTDPVGTATLTFTSCNDATFDYTFTAGELSGTSGSIALTRLGTTPAACSFSTNN